jgi:hypothetical protein
MTREGACSAEDWDAAYVDEWELIVIVAGGTEKHVPCKS